MSCSNADGGKQIYDEGCESTGSDLPPHESEPATLPLGGLKDDGDSKDRPEKEIITRPWGQEDSSDGNEASYITSAEFVASARFASTADDDADIRATVALGLERVSAGIYAAVRHGGREWRTVSERPSTNHDDVVWGTLIPIPSEASATIDLEVYASFEQGMPGAGKQLRRMTATVERLLGCGSGEVVFSFSPEDGDIASACSSISVTVERRRSRERGSSSPRVLSPCRISERSRPRIPGSWRSQLPVERVGEPEDPTNGTQSDLSRDPKHGKGHNPEHSVAQFYQALGLCPFDGAVVQENGAEGLLPEVDGVQWDDPSSVVQDSTARTTILDLTRRLFQRFEWFGDLGDLQQAIAVVRTLGRSTSILDEHYLGGQCLLGGALLHRFNRLGQLGDLEEAILTLRNAAHLTPHDHLDKPCRLNNLGASLSARFKRLGEIGDLEEAISTQRDAVHLARGCPHILHLRNFSNFLRTRFQRLKKLDDLEELISNHRDVVQLTPNGNTDKPTCLNDLGKSLWTRFLRLGELRDLEEAISYQRDAVQLAPGDHPHKLTCLYDLGTSLSTHFRRFGGLGYLEEAISSWRDAVQLIPDGDPRKATYLNDLGNLLWSRFIDLGEQCDLEEAILNQRDAVRLTDDDHRDRVARLSDLGTSLWTRFKRLRELGDLDAAILNQRDVVRLTPQGHPAKHYFLYCLGGSLSVRFNCLGAFGDLEEAITTLRDAVRLTPHDHRDRPCRLNDFADTLWIRFKHLRELGDLEEVISTQRDVVQLTPRDHHAKHNVLHNLGGSLFARFKHLGELSDLEEAIMNQRDAVQLTPRDDPDNPCRLNNLGNSLWTRFEHCGELGDLEEAISIQRNAVQLTPDSSSHKAGHLISLGNFLLTRFEHCGEISDLEEAISSQRNAVQLIPDHSCRPTYLSSLGTSLWCRFECLGELRDLEEAIPILRYAAQHMPNGHYDKPICLNNLGGSLWSRFEHLGELRDMEEAISCHRDAVQLTPDSNPIKHGWLSNLGGSLSARFEHLGELSDLEEAISTLRDAVQLTPEGHPDKPCRLNNLGSTLWTRFEHLEELSDLEEAISNQRDAVRLTLDGRPDKHNHLNSLGNFLSTYFDCVGGLSVLEESISTLRDAIQLTPCGHPQKPSLLCNLGESLTTRFRQLGDLGDLEEAILTRRDAVHLTPRGHCLKPNLLNSLGNSFRIRFEHLGELRDLEDALSIYAHAASAPSGSVDVRFRASQNWISCARRIRHPSLLRAYAIAIDLLPRLAWAGLSLTHRYYHLSRGADVVREAAAAALDANHPEIAMEWLERGRSIVWGEMYQLRSSYEELSTAFPDHARRLQELFAELDRATITREKSLSAEFEQGMSSTTGRRPDTTLRKEADRHRLLAIERDALLQEIRKLPGFEGFLRQKTLSQFRASAHAGPVVILNAAESRCDALIVLANVDHVIHVPLTNFTLKRSANLRHTLKSFVRSEREGKSVKLEGVSWESCLSPLWQCVVKPVLDALAFSVPGDLSRIFWCPTGPFAFLPIHAAGFYDSAYSRLGHKVFDFVISSYVPSLATLSPSFHPSTSSVGPSDKLRLLAVRQPPSDGQTHLPGVVTELEHIKDVVQNSPSACTTVIESSTGSVEEVLALMKDADWTHFACHGVQDGVDSGLCLADRRRLKVRDVIALSRPSRGGLAFLSACQTAKGEERLSDEAVHVAAGMLLAGYGGVVGTMWSISDSIAPVVARAVYERLFRGGSRPNHREAARALHDAIARVREDDAVSFGDWVPFIHVGL